MFDAGSDLERAAMKVVNWRSGKDWHVQFFFSTCFSLKQGIFAADVQSGK